VLFYIRLKQSLKSEFSFFTIHAFDRRSDGYFADGQDRDPSIQRGSWPKN